MAEPAPAQPGAAVADRRAAEAALRQRIAGADEPLASGRALRRFAEDWALDPALHDEAVLLNLDLDGADAGLRESLRAEMAVLLDRIVADVERQGEGAARARQQHERERALAALRVLREGVQATGAHDDRAFEGRGLGKTWSADFRLSPFDLTLRLGQITGVVGQNAQGKTTLLRIVAGELRADQGRLAYPVLGETGADIDWVHVKRHIAFVPQELPAWRGSLRDTLHFEAALHGVLGADNEREVRFVVERLDLTGHLDKRWGELSGGTRLRFALARALVWKPRLLVMDEPLANLDLHAKNVLLQDVRDLAASFRYPIAVLMSSHELYALERVCQQMVFLRGGQVVYAGDPAGVAGRSAVNEFELGTSIGAAELRRRLPEGAVIEVAEDGLNLLLRTDRATDHRMLLRLLLDHGVDVEHFRDITHSVRRLFS